MSYEPWHAISNNVVCATSKASDQPAHTCTLIRAFASCFIQNSPWVLSYWLNIILEFLLFKGGCTGSSESILVKMSHCWKSCVTAHICSGFQLFDTLVFLNEFFEKVYFLKIRFSRHKRNMQNYCSMLRDNLLEYLWHMGLAYFFLHSNRNIKALLQTKNSFKNW